MLDKPKSYKVNPNKHPHCKPVVDYIYWHVLGSFDNWNIIQFTNKTTSMLHISVKLSCATTHFSALSFTVRKKNLME